MRIHEKVKCNDCDRTFEIIYNHRDGLPNGCVFCGFVDGLELIEEIKEQSLVFAPGVR